jgi:hypothetical protein
LNGEILQPEGRVLPEVVMLGGKFSEWHFGNFNLDGGILVIYEDLSGIFVKIPICNR